MRDIYELSADEIQWLAVTIRRAELEGRTVRVCIDGGLKIKIGEGIWTLPFGRKES